MTPVGSTVIPEIRFKGRKDNVFYELILTPHDDIVLGISKADAQFNEIICHYYGLSGVQIGKQSPWHAFKYAGARILWDWRLNNELSYDFTDILREIEKTTSLVDENFLLQENTIAFDALIYIISHSPVGRTGALTLADPVELQIGSHFIDLSGFRVVLDHLGLGSAMVLNLEPNTRSLINLQPLRIDIDATNPTQVLRSHARVIADVPAEQVAELKAIADLLRF